MSANLENSAVAIGLEKVSFHSNAKECSNCHTIVLISHSSKVMLRILQARLRQSVNYELPDVQAGFRKGKRTRDQLANNRWIIEKAREFQKNIYFCFIDYAKAFDCVDHEFSCMQVKNQQLESDMEQQTCPTLGKEYVKAVYYHPAYLTYMQSTS